MTPKHNEKLRQYVATLGEQERGITRVTLPLGSVAAIERLTWDIEAFGFGAGSAEMESAEQFAWMDKAKLAREALMENARALSRAVEANASEYTHRPGWPE